MILLFKDFEIILQNFLNGVFANLEISFVNLIIY